MGRALCVALAVLFASHSRADDLQGSAPRLTLGADEHLVAGADALRAGQFDDGIRLTLIALARSDLSVRDRAAGLANVCAGYVAKDEPDEAIPYCDQSLQLDDRNWRVYTVRARAYFLKEMFAQAERDNEAAAAINPDSAHVKEIRGKLNERRFDPEIVIIEN